MSTYKELLAQRAQLEKQIEEARAREYVVVIDEIRQKMADYGITIAELGAAGRGKGAQARAVSNVAPKYRDPVTGNTWSGRGKPPHWIAGKDRDDFLIEK